MTLRVAIHQDEDGTYDVYHDEGVEVIIVCDFAPADRLYKMKRYPIPERMLDGDVGRLDDDSPAQKRALRAVADFHGEKHLTVVDDQS